MKHSEHCSGRHRAYIVQGRRSPSSGSRVTTLDLKYRRELIHVPAWTFSSTVALVARRSLYDCCEFSSITNEWPSKETAHEESVD